MGHKGEGSSDMPVEKQYATDFFTAEENVEPVPGDNELHRALKARHITMIGMSSSDVDCHSSHSRQTNRCLAIGGAIGTGLIIGTGSALAK